MCVCMRVYMSNLFKRGSKRFLIFFCGLIGFDFQENIKIISCNAELNFQRVCALLFGF